LIKKWQTGETCVLRGIVNHQVWSALSAIMVKDQPEETVLLLIPGAQCAIPEGLWRRRMNQDYPHGSRWKESRQENFVLREFTWQTNRVLILLEPEKYYSCFLFWEHFTSQFGCYYINYQLPYRRSHCGFDTLDLDLDIVVDPQFNWKWKDEEEYRAGILEGGIQDEWVIGIEGSHLEVFDRIARRSYPFDGSWLDWRPEPGWEPPTLPDGWHAETRPARPGRLAPGMPSSPVF
jgi:hypothetical protein